MFTRFLSLLYLLHFSLAAVMINAAGENEGYRELYGQESWIDEVTEQVTKLSIDFKGRESGCKNASDSKTCDIVNANLDHLPGFFDATTLYNNPENSFQLRNAEIVFIDTKKKNASNPCPDLVVPDASKGKLFLITDNSILDNNHDNKCSLHELAMEARKHEAVGVLASASACRSNYNETFSEMPKMIEYCWQIQHLEANHDGFDQEEIEKFVAKHDKSPLEIPVLVLTIFDALRIRECLDGKPNITSVMCKQNSQLKATIQWNIPQKPENVEFALADHVYYEKKPFFLDSRFFDFILPSLIDLELKFKHKMILWKPNDKFCDQKPIYCNNHCIEKECIHLPKSAHENGVSGSMAIIEGVRRRCLISLQTHVLHIPPWKYWVYLQQFYKHCQLKRSFNRDCSHKAMKSVEIDYKKVEMCTAIVLKGINTELENDMEDSLLISKKVISNLNKTDDAGVTIKNLLHVLCHVLNGTDVLSSQCMTKCQEKIDNHTEFKECVIDNRKPDTYKPNPYTNPKFPYDEEQVVYQNEFLAGGILLAFVVLALLSALIGVILTLKRKLKYKKTIKNEYFDTVGGDMNERQPTTEMMNDHLSPISPSSSTSREIELS